MDAFCGYEGKGAVVGGGDSDDACIGDLPRLWHSTEWVVGFHNIVDRIHEIRTANRWTSHLDHSHPPDNADVIAYVGFKASPV